MKKLLLSLICLFSFATINVHADEIKLPEKTDHEKVTIYIFRGSGCSHCYDALTYFNDEISEYSDYIEVKTYEVWYTEANSALLDDVVKAKGEQRGGVPYIIIGKDYSKTGFMNEWGEELIEKALEEYQNDDYEDLVAKTAEGHPDAKLTTLYEAAVEEGIVVEKRDTSNDAVVIIAIFGVVILGGAALVFFSRKK